MKFRSFFVMALLLSIQFLNAQVVNIPDKAKEHFAKKYPAATEIEWTNNLANYTVKFELDSLQQTAHYDINGNWTYTDYPLDFENFPEEVKKAITKSRFSDWKIESSGFVENSKEQKLYRVEFKSGINKRYVYYNETGKEVKYNVKL